MNTQKRIEAIAIEFQDTLNPELYTTLYKYTWNFLNVTPFKSFNVSPYDRENIISDICYKLYVNIATYDFNKYSFNSIILNMFKQAYIKEVSRRSKYIYLELTDLNITTAL